ncbi:hypothetical protein B0T13DRAFT_178358 [Neurospora crassa]|nr:hypothetical protein B0T13DRAFT_178358 [Neurospora crassa]
MSCTSLMPRKKFDFLMLHIQTMISLLPGLGYFFWYYTLRKKDTDATPTRVVSLFVESRAKQPPSRPSSFPVPSQPPFVLVYVAGVCVCVHVCPLRANLYTTSRPWQKEQEAMEGKGMNGWKRTIHFISPSFAGRKLPALNRTGQGWKGKLSF